VYLIAPDHPSRWLARRIHPLAGTDTPWTAPGIVEARWC